MVSNITNLVHELPHEFSKDLTLTILPHDLPHGIFAAGGGFVPTQEKKNIYDLRKLGYFRKISNVGADAAQCPVFLVEINC